MKPFVLRLILSEPKSGAGFVGGIFLASLFLLAFLMNSCKISSCSEEEIALGSCSNSFKDKKAPSGSPVAITSAEFEPNDFYYQANTLLQTIENDKSINIDNKSFSRVGTVDTSLDVDWYKIELSGADFDKITPSLASCNADDYTSFTSCYDHLSRKPAPNQLADNKDYVTNGTTNGQKFMKPRFVVRVESIDGSDLGLRVEVYPPGININSDGSITKKSIADSFHNVLNSANALATVNGTLRLANAASALKLMFPIQWEHTVRSAEFNSQDGFFYHTCWNEQAEGISGLPYTVSKPQVLAYQDLIQKDLNGFRALDPYTSGTYFIKVTSNAAYRDKKYRIMWHWNTFDEGASYGGVRKYTMKAEAGPADQISVSLSYNDQLKQNVGSSGVEAVPSGFCGQEPDANSSRPSSAGNPPFNGTKPYCRLPTANITCTHPVTMATSSAATAVLCFNVHNLSGNVKTTFNTLCSNTGDTGTNQLCRENQLQICEGDMNRDGKISSIGADIGCLIDRSVCYNAGLIYDEDNRPTDCQSQCNYY